MSINIELQKNYEYDGYFFIITDDDMAHIQRTDVNNKGDMPMSSNETLIVTLCRRVMSLERQLKL